MRATWSSGLPSGVGIPGVLTAPQIACEGSCRVVGVVVPVAVGGVLLVGALVALAVGEGAASTTTGALDEATGPGNTTSFAAAGPLL